MGERVDLDWTENYLSGRASNGLGRPLGIDVTLAIVAELRAARKVIRLAPRPVLYQGEGRRGVTLLFDRAYVDALADYDQAAQP
jgi:hypothetical protein